MRDYQRNFDATRQQHLDATHADVVIGEDNRAHQD
jgi:hypothetical protein